MKYLLTLIENLRKSRRRRMFVLVNIPLIVAFAVIVFGWIFGSALYNELQFEQFVTNKKDFSIEDAIRISEDQWRLNTKSKLRYPKMNHEFRWTRVHFNPNPSAVIRLQASVFDVFVETTDFFLVENGRVIDSAQSGYNRFHKSSYLPVTQGFRFSTSPTAPRTLYVRTSAPGYLPTKLVINNDAEATFNLKTLNIVFGLLIGGAFGMGFYNLFLAVVTRQRVFLSYAALLFATGCESLFLTGFMATIWPSVGAKIRSFALSIQLLYVFATGMLLLFQTDYCKFLKNHPRSHAFTRKVYFALAAMTVIILLLPHQFSTVIAIVIGTGMLLKQQYNMRHYLRHIRAIECSVLNSGFLASWIVSYAVLFGEFGRVVYASNTFLITGIVLSTFFSSLLAVRLREVEADRRKIIRHHGAKSESTEVCVMFIDIVSFSQMATPMPSRRVFTALSEKMRQISTVVAGLGGAIDRSLGDGMLCFFGSEGTQSIAESVMSAFHAAIRIQELTLAEARAHGVAADSSMIMPVRIGIHSASVSIGNIGGEARIDFTMVGSGVNFARRLETACTPFKIIVSKDCRDQLEKVGISDAGFSEIAIAVKHQTNLVSACEYDPFFDRPDLLREVESKYLDQIGAMSFDQIVDVKDVGAVRLESPYGSFAVKDLSLYGFRVAGPVLFGQRSVLTVKLVTSDPAINQLLEDKLIDQLSVEVRWGKAAGAGFEHGLKMFGGNKAQRGFIYDTLKSRFGAQSEVAGLLEPLRDSA